MMIEYVITSFDDGTKLIAAMAEQAGQRDTAQILGCTVQEMNETHDLFHTAVAEAIGLRCSPALWAAAHGEATDELYGLEEEAVLAVQKFWFAAIKKGWKK